MAEILYSVLLIALFSIVLLKHRFFNLPGIKRRYVILALYLKIIAGLGITFLYTNYYTDRSEADIFKYFDDSKIMHDAIKESPKDYFQMLLGINNDNTYFDNKYYKEMNHWYREYETVTYNDTHTIIRVNAFIRLFSFGFFQVHNLLMIFLSFLGLVALYKAFYNYFKDKAYLIFSAIFLIPSVVLWSSGALKESILIFAMGIFIYSIQQIIFISFSFFRVITAALGVFLLFYTKMYVLAILVPVLLANIWVIYSNNRNILFKHLISLFFFIDIVVLIGYFFPDYNVFQLLVGKQHDFIGLAIHENAGSFISPFHLEANFLSFLYYSPQALINTLFRPFIGDISSPIMLLSLIENFILIILITLSIAFPIKRNKNWRIIIFYLFFSILLFILLGLTTPVLGALVRYRIPALPFFVMALFLIIDFKKISNFFLRKKTKSTDA